MKLSPRVKLLKARMRQFSRELPKQEARGSRGEDEVRDIKEAMKETLEELAKLTHA